MTQTVSFPEQCVDRVRYFVLPESGKGPGVLVIQEWWGLDSGIREMTNRLGAAGFVALAPDLYHGELAAHDEMDKAAHLMRRRPICALCVFCAQPANALPRRSAQSFGASGKELWPQKAQKMPPATV